MLRGTCCKSRKYSLFLVIHFMELGIIVFLALCSVGNGQFHRRPVSNSNSASSIPSSPASQAYRLKWLEFLRLRTTVPPRTRPNSGTTVVSRPNDGGNGVIVNGFLCERTFDTFPNKNNPRMYHLCARNRDKWFVYHYSCPQGSIFNDGTKRCTQTRDVTTTSSSSTVRTTTSRTRRPLTTTVRPRPLLTTTATTSITTVPTTTTIITTSTSPVTTPSTEVPAPVPEPEATETIMSSEEFSTEEMGVRDVIIHDSPMKDSSDEFEEVTNENDETSDESNMIPESDNEPSRLSSVSPNSFETKQKEVTKKGTTSNHSSKTKNKNTVGTDGASGGRRPRILKKWRGYISNY